MKYARNSCAVLTTAYPKALSYSYDFFKSMNDQSMNKFDLIVINDGVSDLEIEGKYKNGRTSVHHSNKSAAQNRISGIREAKRLGYEYLIFADFDDYHLPQRVGTTLSALKRYDIVATDISCWQGDFREQISETFGRRFKSSIDIELNDVIHGNFLGLSNTGIRLSRLPDFIAVSDVIAFDWYFFSTLLSENFSCHFFNLPLTLYRQHDQNLLGYPDHYQMNFSKLTQIKLKHYHAMYLQTEMQIFRAERDRLIAGRRRQLHSNPLWLENI